MQKSTSFWKNIIVVWGNLFLVLGLAAFMMLALTGCAATEAIAQGITTKNISGNGMVVDTHIGLNTESKIPEIRSLFVDGDIATVKSGTNAVSYREESSSSVWNASSVTKKRFLAITLTDAGDVPAAIRAVAAVFREAEAVSSNTGNDVADAAAEAAPAATESAKTGTENAGGAK